MAFIEVFSLMSTFWRVFIIIGYWILSKAFPPSIELIIWLLFFNVLMCVHYTDWFMDIKKALGSLRSIPVDHGVWSFQSIVGFGLLESFGWFLLSMFISNTGLYFFFHSLLFMNQGDMGLTDWILKYSFISNLHYYIILLVSLLLVSPQHLSHLP